MNETVIETAEGRITIEKIDDGFWCLIEWDNGAGNSPAYEDWEREDGPFDTAEEAEEEARSFLSQTAEL